MQTCKNVEGQVTIKKLIVAIFATAILLLTSLDMFGIDGVLPLIQAHFNVNGAQTAIIRTASTAVHTDTLGFMWIFGDVIGRRKLYLMSAAAWIVSSILSIVLGFKSFLIFIVFRSLGSAMTAVLGVLTPVLMADLFSNRVLGVVLMCMTAVEMMLGYTGSSICSSFIVSNDFPWQTGLLSWPVLALLPLAGMMCLLKKKHRHKKHQNANIIAGAFGPFTNKSFVYITVAMSLSSAHSKGIGFWMPSVILSAWTSYPSAFLGLSYPSVTTFNSFTFLAGNVVGMPLVLWVAQGWHHRSGLFARQQGYARAYPLVVGIGSLMNCLMFIFDMLIIDKNYIAHLISSFVSGIGSSAEISLVILMIMMVWPERSQASAIALARFIAGIVSTPSAQIIGFLSDKFLGTSTLEADRFHSFQLALLISSVILITSVSCYFALAIYFEKDCQKAREDEQAANSDEVADERTSLINTSKGRSESLINCVIRSRVHTLQSIH